MMHVLLNAYGYPIPGAKGNPFIKDIAEGIASRKHNISVLHTRFNGWKSLLNNARSNVLHDSEISSIYHLQVSFFSWIPMFILGRRATRTLILNKLFSYLDTYSKKNGQFDLVQHHYILNADLWISEAIATYFDIPLVIFEHSPTMSREAIRIKATGLTDSVEVESIVGSASLRFARTERFAKIYDDLFKADFEIMPSFVPANLLDSSAKIDPSLPQHSWAIIGSLTHRKNQSLAIESLKLIDEVNRPKLLIIGSGPDLSMLKSLTEKLQLNPWVSFLGEIPKAEVISLIAKVTGVVVTSKVESFGNTVIEAMACGKPVVSTTCGGPEEIISEPYLGELVDFNKTDIARAMVDIQSNYERYDPSLIHSHFNEHYAEEVVIDRLLNRYNFLLKKQ